MIQIKEGEVEKIISCEDPTSVACFIDTVIANLQNEGVHNDLIMTYIQELDLSLIPYKSQTSIAEKHHIIEHAQQILMNKILNGLDS